MVIEFRKVAQTPKNFTDQFDSVKIEGNFCKISPYLIEIDSKLSGSIVVDCSRCGETFSTKLDEEMGFLISDGIYKENDNSKKDLDKVIVEVDDHLIDFNEILKSELESFKLDYHVCNDCQNTKE